MGRENEEAALRHERTLNEIASARCARIQGAKNPRACKKERERERERTAPIDKRAALAVALRRDATRRPRKSFAKRHFHASAWARAFVTSVQRPANNINSPRAKRERVIFYILY